MLDLYLLRHGKAANPAKYDKDFNRPLNKKGIAQINQVGYLLEQERNGIGQILSSSAFRTRDTAEIINFYLKAPDVSFHDDLYLADQETILSKIKKEATAKSLIYVGHNFGISDLAAFIGDDPLSMTTGMIIHFQFDFDDWKLIEGGTGVRKGHHWPNVYIPSDD